MALIDADLQSVQEARILLERAVQAQHMLEELPERIVDAFICELARRLLPQCEALAEQAVGESDYGCARDEAELLRWVLTDLLAEVRAEQPVRRICAGAGGAAEGSAAVPSLRLPKGVAVSLVPDWLAVPTLVSQLLFAVKAHSAIVFSARPRIHGTCAQLMDEVAEAARACSYPLGALGYLGTYAEQGEAWLAAQPAVRVLLDARETGPGAADTADEGRAVPGTRYLPARGCDVYRACIGNNPVFVETTADVTLAAREITDGASFAYGMLPGAEQAVVVEAAVAGSLRAELARCGCRFLSDDEADRLAATLFAPDGRPYPELIAKPAFELARRAGVAVPDGTRVLVVERPYVSARSVLSGVKYGPVISLYVEDDWRDACEKCIELILAGGQGNALAIFSRDPAVIEQFAVKKPVGRVVVNAGTGLGAIGWHADLPRTLTLAGWERASTSELGVTCRDFTRRRLVGRGACPADGLPRATWEDSARLVREACALQEAAEPVPPASVSAPTVPSGAGPACAPVPAVSDLPDGRQADWFGSLLHDVARTQRSTPGTAPHA